MSNSYNYSEKQFKESVSVALKEVAWQILTETGRAVKFDSIAPVEIISKTCFLVNVNDVINKETLKSHLIAELKKHEIYSDFEFAIFDPISEMMEEGIYITSGFEEKSSVYEFPVNENYINYFVIHFPDRSKYFNSNLSIWYFFTGLLLLVVLFFGYTLSVIIRQRQLSEIQKNFINNLTHELKTPISSIALSANVINDKNILKSPKRLFEYARIIKEQNNRLSKNVEKVLNLASLEKNKIRLKLEEVDLKTFLDRTAEHFKQSDFGQKANIQIIFEQKETIVLADKFHFSNLIINILENAVKYCDKNPIVILDIISKKHAIEISITDNGIGIPKEYKKKIFKKFFRVPTGNVHNVKGFGLGLDYVHKIVKAHRWKIKVVENPEGGSIFTLSIKK